MAKANQKHETILVELPANSEPEGQFGTYLEGKITARQYRALRSVQAGLNGKMGVYAKAGGKLATIHVVRCILEQIADAMDTAAAV